jgi:hypothetical protein
LEDLHLHDLRHEALSRFYEMGADYSGGGLDQRPPRSVNVVSLLAPMRQRVLEVIDRSDP